MREASTVRAERTTSGMHAELFGLFAGLEEFEAFAAPEAFDRVLTGDSVTIGLSDTSLGIPGRSGIAESDDGFCVVWGEAFPPDEVDRPTADWLLDRYATAGSAAFDELNGSYVAVIEEDTEAVVVGDLLRSRECFYSDANGFRVFGTDAARVAQSIPSPTIDEIGLNHLLHCGVVFQERSLLREMRCIPFDGYLTDDDTGSLGRVVYAPRERDQREYSADLAERLERAVLRRSNFPRRRGILSSAGFDSRVVIGTVPDLDVSYTIGTPTTPEVIVAKRVAKQYDVEHTVLPVTDDYLTVTPEVIQYTNGVRESIHIHHRGNVDDIDVTSIYHGLLLDTVLRDIYLPTMSLNMVGHQLPLPGLEPNPDPFSFMQHRLGIYTDHPTLLGAGPRTSGKAAESFLRDEVTTAIETCMPEADSIYNAMSMTGLKVTQALPFKTHLADNFIETLVAADSELIDWHLTTPPKYRNKRTFQAAIDRLDDRLLRHRPPDRPHRSHMLNGIEGFFRRRLPILKSPGTPWPDRDAIYNRMGMDDRLFPTSPAVHGLPPRIKLRIHDAVTWLELATGETCDPDELLTLP